MAEEDSDPMSMSYSEIKKDLNSAEAVDVAGEETVTETVTPERPDDDFDSEGRPFLGQAGESKPPKEKKTKIKPRKDIICEDCGGTYSSKTKAHRCRPPHGFVKSPPDPAPAPARKDPVPPPSPPPAQAQAQAESEREITMEDVRGYLVRAKAAKAEHRRNTWISSLF